MNVLKQNNKNTVCQPTNFKFCLGKNVKDSSGNVGTICALIAKNYKLMYDVIFEKNDLVCNLKEIELEDAD